MIKKNELRIGITVFYFGRETTLHNETELLNAFEQLEMGFIIPIPLTEEWLLKLGFDMNPDWNKKRMDGCVSFLELGYLYIAQNMLGGITLYDNESLSTGVHIYFVHQLQNLYFALTGNELTIK
jgi:hypothetical protein